MGFWPKCQELGPSRGENPIHRRIVIGAIDDMPGLALFKTRDGAADGPLEATCPLLRLHLYLQYLHLQVKYKGRTR